MTNPPTSLPEEMLASFPALEAQVDRIFLLATGDAGDIAICDLDRFLLAGSGIETCMMTDAETLHAFLVRCLPLATPTMLPRIYSHDPMKDAEAINRVIAPIERNRRRGIFWERFLDLAAEASNSDFLRWQRARHRAEALSPPTNAAAMVRFMATAIALMQPPRLVT